MQEGYEGRREETKQHGLRREKRKRHEIRGATPTKKKKILLYHGEIEEKCTDNSLLNQEKLTKDCSCRQRKVRLEIGRVEEVK